LACRSRHVRLPQVKVRGDEKLAVVGSSRGDRRKIRRTQGVWRRDTVEGLLPQERVTGKPGGSQRESTAVAREALEGDVASQSRRFWFVLNIQGTSMTAEEKYNHAYVSGNVSNHACHR
ncbi:unnamed protein product, partial [Pylaiella littoralis]